MDIKSAIAQRENVISLLSGQGLVVSDLPPRLENFVVAIQDEIVTGTAGLEIYGNFGLLRSVAVLPGYRNMGVASALVSHMETLARANGLRAVYLLTETAPDYFRKKNYEMINREEVPTEVQHASEFSYACPKSAIVMKKSL
jgi:amino-acid N-acetyltransferase